MAHAGWGESRQAQVNTCGHPDARHYAKGLCRQCYRTTPEFKATRHRYYKANKADFDRHAAHYRKSKKRVQQLYGISPAEYFAMEAAQGGLCAVCRRPPGKKGLGVDHCHVSGRVRALLCALCNAALGAFRDEPTICRAAADYLDHHHSLRAEAAPAPTAPAA